MKPIAIAAALAAIALSGCAASPEYMHETTQPMTVNSTPGATCTGTRGAEALFSAPAGSTVTITKSKDAIKVVCTKGDRRAEAVIESSRDSLSMSPLWDYASGSLNKYPAAIFVEVR